MKYVKKIHDRKHVAQHERALLDQYNMIKLWEARGREMYLYALPITTQTRHLLRIVGLLNFFEEATSLKGNSALLCHNHLMLGSLEKGILSWRWLIVPTHRARYLFHQWDI